MNVKLKDKKTGRMVIYEIPKSKHDSIDKMSPEQIRAAGKPIGIQISDNQWAIDNGLGVGGPQFEPVDEVSEYDALPVWGEISLPEDSDEAEALDLYGEDEDS